MSERWERRSERAKRDAINDERADFDLTEPKEAVIREDLAVGILCGAIAELKEAESRLGSEAETRSSVQALHEQLVALTE